MASSVSIFDREAPAITGDNGARGRRSLDCADVNVTMRTICVVQNRTRSIFNFNIMQSRIAPSGYGFRHTAEPGVAIKKVRRLIQEHTATLSLPRPAPGA